MRRPLLGILFFFAAGTLAGLALLLDPFIPLLAAWLCAAIALLVRRSSYSSTFLFPALFFAAWCHAALVAYNPSPRALHRLMDRPREHVTIRGMVADDPVEQRDERGGASVWRMTLDVQHLNRAGYDERATGRVDVHWMKPADAPPPAYGDVWAFSGVLHHREWSDWRWAFVPPYRMRSDEADGRRLSVQAGSRVKQISFAGRRAAAERLGLGLDAYPDIAGIMRALLLGYRHDLPDAHHRLFARTGTLHIFAISGLHIGILAGVLLMLTRICGASPRAAVLWVAPLLILYTVATGLRPSAVRACVMALAFGSAFLFRRKPDAPSAWALAALIILAASPAQLTSPGFIFSFVIVAGLIRLYPLFTNSTQALASPDAYGMPLPLGDEPLPRRVARWGIGLACASLAAWLASTPLTAQYFNLFTPIGLIGNLFVIPAAFVVVLTGLLSLVAGFVSAVGSEIFNHANRAILSALIYIIDALAGVPGGHRYVRSPGLFAVLLWYAFLFAGLLWRTQRMRRVGYALLVVVSGAGLWVSHTTQADVVRVLNAGDGHAVLIRSAGRHYLFDAGPAYRAERLTRDLRAEGVNRLDALILSHAAGGHVGGVEAVLDEIPVRKVWRTDFPSRSPVYDRALAAVAKRGIPVVTRSAGDRGVWPGGLSWEVLHPADSATHRRAADASLVLRLHRGTVGVLLSGGAGGAAERAILGRRTDPAASVWVAGNQGSDRLAGADWLAAVRPSAVVLSVGAHNRHGYPDDDVLARLETYAADRADPGLPFLWRTDEAGAVDLYMSSRIRRGRQQDRWFIRSEWGRVD